MNTKVRKIPLKDSSGNKEQGPVCPNCKGRLERVSLRLIDQLCSRVVPLRRYRCPDTSPGSGCGWQGNLRIDKTDHSDTGRYAGSAKQWPGLRSLSDVRSGSEKKTPNGTEPPVKDLLEDAAGDLSFKDMAQITLESIGDAVLVVNPQGNVIYLNSVAELLTGWLSEESIGRPVDEVFHIVDRTTRKPVKSPSHRAIHEGRIVELALGSVLIRRDGTDLAIEDSAAPIPNRFGKIVGAVIVFHDARKAGSVIQEMSYLAHHDFLTGLPNRVLLIERLTQAIGMAKRHRKQIALLFLDLDGFKKINDTFGHGVGDQLLRDIAADIVLCVRATDTVSRHGGDEFVVLLAEMEEPQDADRIGKKIRKRIARPRVVNGHEIQIRMSIGISIYPDDGIDADTLMDHADKSMYQRKNPGRNDHRFSHEGHDRAFAISGSDC